MVRKLRKYYPNIRCFILCFAFLLNSCSKAIPAGFWVNFQKKLLVRNVSDQGPDGGTRAMYWKAEKQNTFTPNAIIDFASKKGWLLVDSVHFSVDSVKTWKLFDENVFPLSGRGFSSSEKNNGAFKHFPRWINSNITLYKFKTGWVLFEPGTDSSTEINGFVIINDIGTEMSAYHFWGD